MSFGKRILLAQRCKLVLSSLTVLNTTLEMPVTLYTNLHKALKFIIRFQTLKNFSCVSIEVRGMNETVTLNDGHKMPLFGLGVFDVLGGSCRGAVKFALQNGYRLIDTASYYK